MESNELVSVEQARALIAASLIPRTAGRERIIELAGACDSGRYFFSAGYSGL